MREIKFRAWDKVKNKMFHNVQNSYDTIGEVQPEDCWVSFDCVLEDKDMEIMQSTGLSDKNGKDIYEGDIVKFDGHTYEDKFTGTIVFSNGMFRPDYWMEPLGSYKYLEIIGNIYENPELLAQEKPQP